MNLTDSLSKHYIRDIANGKSHFSFIPKEIGELEFCATTNTSKPYTKEQKKKKLLYWIGIPILITVIAGLFVSDKSFCVFLLIITFIIIYVKVKKFCVYKGTDYFVGNKGFAKITFKGSRDNIISKNIHLFKDFSQLIIKETLRKQNSFYVTDYSFRFFSQPISTEKGSSYMTLVIDEIGSYQINDFDDDPLNEHYSFWSHIDRVWTTLKHNELILNLQKEPVHFYILSDTYSENWIATPYISISSESIIIGGENGKIYYRDEIKNIRIDSGYLVIEHINHSSSLFGLMEKGDIEYVRLSNVGNKTLLMLCLQSFFNYNIQMV